MDQQKRRPRSTALMAGFEVVGDILLLQILFVVASLPLVTIVPAAIALQRALRKTVIEQKPGLTRTFLKEFKWAWRRLGLVGLIAPFVVAAAVLSILFWLASPGVVGLVALCVIIPVCGLAAAAYLALLGAAMTAEENTTRSGLIARTRALLLSNALPLAGALIALSTWLLLAFRLPTLIPIGSGLVPALLAWLLVRRQISALGGISG
ncbi:DUF624 domain-containing protein [Arthrobacter sp. LjRoot14]|uniref:DUF624 domain-containing protein n=1 Tax=Arthrobacter sp. LjRoot14 TaxID=3342265 RepID=UPI003F4FDCD3